MCPVLLEHEFGMVVHVERQLSKLPVELSDLGLDVFGDLLHHVAELGIRKLLGVAHRTVGMLLGIAIGGEMRVAEALTGDASTASLLFSGFFFKWRWVASIVVDGCREGVLLLTGTSSVDGWLSSVVRSTLAIAVAASFLVVVSHLVGFAANGFEEGEAARHFVRFLAGQLICACESWSGGTPLLLEAK